MSEPRTPAGAWLIVTLLFFFMAINFADKAVIGLVAVPLMQELKLSPSQFGLIGSSFFLLFSISAIVTGFIANRVQTRWLLLVMGLVWALTQFPMLAPIGFGTIIACRIGLGAGEGPAYPVALHATYKWFPNELRTLPTSIVTQGAAMGILIALPLLNWVVVHYSWHWAFGSLGVAGLVWAAAWAAFGREGSVQEAATPAAMPAAQERVPYSRLLLSPTVLSSWCANFGAYWALTLAITWQGSFLIKGLGFTQGGIGLLAALPSAVSVVVVVAGGWLSQLLMARGISSRVARGLFGGVSVALGGVALLAMPAMPTNALKIAMTVVAIALPSIIYVIVPAVIGEITPVAQRGAMLAIGNAVATSAGLLAPYIMGSVIEGAATPLDGFYTGFTICGVIMLVGGIVGMALIRPERETARSGRGLAKSALQGAP
jgi:ACS family D-galactonate transporter-like MFS transporter